MTDRPENRLGESPEDEPTLDPNQQAQPQEVVMMMQEAVRTRSGPLPEGEEIQMYERVLPGAADRIVSMSESEVSHRHRLESVGLYAGVGSVAVGLVGAFVLVLLGFGYLGILFAVVGTAFPLVSTLLKDRRP